MKKRWISLVAVVFAAMGGIVSAGEADLQELMAKLASQEARLQDLNAKLAGPACGEAVVADGITSLRKNATVTIGGLVTTKYTYQQATVDSIYNTDRTDGPYDRAATGKYGSLEVSDAELHVGIEVNDYFDAFLEIDLHNGDGEDYALAKAYWVRWKNICNTGFGLKVGRDALVFGEEGVGELGSYAANSGDGIGEIEFGDMGYVIPPSNGWDVDGVTQITPYWESSDGKFLAELSFIQNIDSEGPRMNGGIDGSWYSRTSNGKTKYRSKNYGSISGRVAYEPVEGLKLTAGFVNYRSNGTDAYTEQDIMGHKKNNFATALAVSYRPAWFDKMNVWGQWIHGWNVENVENCESDAINLGVSFDFTDNLTFFVQGDYLRNKMDNRTVSMPGRPSYDWEYKGTAKSVYAGLMYTTDYGIFLEAGWKHERVKWHENGAKTLSAKANTIYGLVGFEF